MRFDIVRRRAQKANEKLVLFRPRVSLFLTEIKSRKLPPSSSTVEDSGRYPLRLSARAQSVSEAHEPPLPQQ